jgi:hypothetical protein
MAFEGSGNMYLSTYNPDTSSAAVYKLATGGVLTSIAPGGTVPDRLLWMGRGMSTWPMEASTLS